VEEATWFVTNCGNNKEEWEIQNLCGFQKVKCNNEERSFSITIHIKKLNTLVGCEAYSSLDGYFGYH
jgi:hypothetical protein